MKKTSVCLVLLLVLFLTCGRSAQALSPPAWILGTWADQFGANTWVFTEDNVVYRVWARYTDGSVTVIDFKQGSQMRGVTVLEESTALTYILAVIEAGGEIRLKFVKTSDTTLDSSRIDTPTDEEPIPLMKQ